MTETMAPEAHQLTPQPKEIAQVIKGKRTKRPRPMSPLTLTVSSSVSSGGERDRNNDNTTTLLSPSTSIESAESARGEEEDMANCLILLAQGQRRNPKSSEPWPPTTSGKVAAGAGLYVYQCKTCNRCFPSFQALGGHRASHKKPNKANHNEGKKPVSVMEEEEDHQIHAMSTTLSLQITNGGGCTSIKSNRVHECSICGAEFSSGQALGGHMRRHRALLGASTTAMSLGTTGSPVSQESKKPRNIATLDLNLPAPEELDLAESDFQFPSKEKLLIFSASSLVDCHY